MHLPVWRFGKPYESLERDTLVHFLTGEPVAEVSQVGGAIVGRDLQKAAQARKALITEPGPIRKILTHLGEPLEPPPVSPARGPPTAWGELVQMHDDREAVQVSPDELPAIDIHSL